MRTQICTVLVWFLLGSTVSFAANTIRTLAGGEVYSLQVNASADQPSLLLVEQMGIDLLIDCRTGAIANAPTGRLGFEAALLEQPTQCEIRPKMAKAVRAPFSVEIVDPRRPVLGADLADWRLYASLLLLDDQILDARRGAVMGFEHLLKNTLLDTRFQLQLELAIASLHRRIRDADAAQNHYAAARDLAKKTKRLDWLATIELGSGLTALDQRDFDAADAAFARAMSAASAIDSPYDLAVAENNRCLVLHHRGALADAGACYQRAALAYERAGETEQRATPLFNWAAVAIQLGDPLAALDALNEARLIREQGPYDRSLGNVYLQLALVHSRLAEWEQALRYSMSAVEVFDRLAEPGDQSRAYRMRSVALRSLGDPERARQYASIAVELARQQKDARYLAGALAESAQLENHGAAAYQLHEAAAAAFREAREEGLALREEAALARRLYQEGRIDEAYARWLALSAMREDPRISIQAKYLLLGAELLAERRAVREAIAMALSAAYKLRSLRALDSELDAHLLLARLYQQSQDPAAARVQLDAALLLHAKRAANLPSPAQLLANARQVLRLKDALIAWHRSRRAEPDINRWMADLATVERTPIWKTEVQYQAHWRRYMFNLSRLQDDNLTAPAAAELLRAVERDESQLDLSFDRAQPALASTAEVLRGWLSPGTAFFAVMRGSQQSLALWLSAQDSQLLDWGDCQSTPALANTAPDTIIYAWGDPELTDIDLARELFPQRESTDLPTILHLVGGIDNASSLALPRLPAQFTVAARALGGDSDQGLSGAKREVDWLRRHYQTRFVERRDAGPAPLAFPRADLLHVAAHGWTFPNRSLAAGLVAELPGSSAPSHEALSIADFSVAKHPALIILNACEAAGSRSGANPWSMARDLAGKLQTAVIAPDDLVDDRAALEFSRTLHRALANQDLLPAYAQAVREFRSQSRDAPMPWRLLWAGSDERALGESLSREQ